MPNFKLGSILKIVFVSLFIVVLSPINTQALSLNSFVLSKNSTNFGSNNFKIRYSGKGRAAASILNTATVNSEVKAIDSTQSEQPKTLNVSGKPSITIAKIGLNQVELNYASVTNMDDLDEKLLYNPLIDTLASEPCTPNTSSYILGHSEPANQKTNDKPAVRIFKDLDQLVAGDEILLKNKAGTECKYRIVGSEIITTGIYGNITQETFNRLYFPQTEGNSILNIQTCVKGSATKRLIVKAVMIK